MTAIGGYFELELRKGEHYHKDALRLNTARNCFEYILLARQYSKVYIPLYNCDVMLEPLHRCGVEYEYYHINQQLEPVRHIVLGNNEAVLYPNYFGIKQKCVERLANEYGGRLIVDNSQAFFAKPIEGIDTFYSARKFFGVPDGAYLYTTSQLPNSFTQDESFSRSIFLLERIDSGPEAGYVHSRNNAILLSNNPIKRMSKLSEAILSSIDYERIACVRKENYSYLESNLGSRNALDICIGTDDVPLVYPLLGNNRYSKKLLIDNRIFVATYWPNVLQDCDSDSLEFQLTDNILHLPIDQRYSISEMQRIVDVLTPQVSIRKLVETDADTSVAWRNDIEVFRYTGTTYTHEITADMEHEWIKKVISNPNEYRCAIEADGNYVGNIYLTDITEESATYHIFIGDKRYWGCGVAKKASELILKYAANELELKEVRLRVRMQNHPAIMLYRHLGFCETERNDEFISMTIQLKKQYAS